MNNSIEEKFGISKDVEPGQFEGKFLLAMPNMGSDIFERSIIYICAHSLDGAMGFQVNKLTEMTIRDLINSTDLSKKDDLKFMSSNTVSDIVRNGGPVDEHRGFVLHSVDYDSEATIPISNAVFLTSSIQILRSIAKGVGPKKVAVSLGYSGWGPGQLEQEIADNAWLIIDADPEVLFEPSQDGKYEQLLTTLGIGSANFIAEGGNA